MGISSLAMCSSSLIQVCVRQPQCPSDNCNCLRSMRLTQHATRCFRVITSRLCVLWRHPFVLTACHVTICCTHRPRSHRFSTPLFTSWLQPLRHGFREALSSLTFPSTFLPCIAAPIASIEIWYKIPLYGPIAVIISITRYHVTPRPLIDVQFSGSRRPYCEPCCYEAVHHRLHSPHSLALHKLIWTLWCLQWINTMIQTLIRYLIDRPGRLT